MERAETLSPTEFLKVVVSNAANRMEEKLREKVRSKTKKEPWITTIADQKTTTEYDENDKHGKLKAKLQRNGFKQVLSVVLKQEDKDRGIKRETEITNTQERPFLTFTEHNQADRLTRTVQLGVASDDASVYATEDRVLKLPKGSKYKYAAIRTNYKQRGTDSLIADTAEVLVSNRLCDSQGNIVPTNLAEALRLKTKGIETGTGCQIDQESAAAEAKYFYNGVTGRFVLQTESGIGKQTQWYQLDLTLPQDFKLDAGFPIQQGQDQIGAIGGLHSLIGVETTVKDALSIIY